MGDDETLKYAGFEVAYQRLLDEEAQLGTSEGRLVPLLVQAITSPAYQVIRPAKLLGTLGHLISKTTEIGTGYVDLETRIPQDNPALRRLINYHAKRSLHYAKALTEMRETLNPEPKSGDTVS